jgi:3-deoxy-D-arabino-heptulosonate 7-phosphate (DAHP) synthase
MRDALRCVELLYERETNLQAHSMQAEDGQGPQHRERLVVVAGGASCEEGESDDEEVMRGGEAVRGGEVIPRTSGAA